MAFINNLKLVSSKKPAQTPTSIKRNKLIKKLQEQIELVNAHCEGQLYTAKRIQWSNDSVTGARIAVEVSKRVRHWFWMTETGKINAVVKYGSATLMLAKGGKNAFEVADYAELTDAYSAIKQAVSAGELDEAIAEASVRTRKAFGK